MLLTHTGRKSGLPHQTVVEVVTYEKAMDTYMIASGWGEKSNWLLNIQKTPEVTVKVGRRKFKARAIRLSVEEAENAFLDYARQHPGMFRALANLMIKRSLEATREDCHLLAQSVPLIALRPQE